MLPLLLAASVTLSGIVVDQRGAPVADAAIRLSIPRTPAVAKTTTTRKGDFHFGHVAPGRYRLRVDARGFRSVTLNVEAPNTSPLRIAVEPSELTVITSVVAHAPASFNATPLTQRSFPREAYRDQGQPSISSVFDQTPGAFTSRDVNVNAAVPDAPAFATVRGGLPFETPTLLDGNAVSLPSNGTFDLSLIPSFVLGQVEILKGPGDVSGSGGSAGGAVNLRTAEPTAVRRATPEIEGDSQGGQFADLAYDGTLPGGKFSFATMASIDGMPGPSELLAGNQLRRALLLDLRAAPDPDWTVTGTMLAVNLDRDLAASEGAQTLGSAVSLAPSLDAQEDQRLRFETLQAQYGSGDDAFSTRFFALDLARDLGSSAFGASAHDGEAGGTIGWTHAVDRNRYGIEVREVAGNAQSNDVYDTPLLAGSHANSLLLRATAQLAPSPRDQVDLSYEQNLLDDDFAPSGVAFAHRSWSVGNARAGYSHTLRPGLALRASAGTSALPPPLAVLSGYPAALQQYVGLPSRVVAAQSFVDSVERANGVDAGLEWRLHGDTTTVSAGLYHTATQEAYVQESSAVAGSTLLTWFNGPNMVDDGVELSIVQFKRVGLGFIAQLALPRTYVSESLRPSFYAAGNLAVLPGQNVSGGAFFVPGENDVAALRVPYAQGYAELSYKWPRGSRASIGALYLGANNAYGRSSLATLNSNIEISVGDRGKLQFSVENLTDALDYRLPLLGAFSLPLADGRIGYANANSLAPRTIRFMYRQSFGSGPIFEH